MQTKVVKVIPNDFKNQSRDLRELSVLSKMGCKVSVVLKESDDVYDYGYDVTRVTTKPFGNITLLKPLNRAFSIIKWAQTIRNKKADIISCHDIICLFIGWLSTVFMKDKPKLVYDSHEFELGRNTTRNRAQHLFYKSLEGFLIKRSSLVIMVSESIADQVAKIYSLKNKPVVVRNIPLYWNLDEIKINDNRQQLKLEHNIPEDAYILIYQGLIAPNRGVERLLKLMSFDDNYYLLLLGDGSESYINAMKHKAQDLNVDKRVIFHAAVPYSELKNYTGVADVAICVGENSCLSHYYSLPNKLFEYIQALVPVVTNNYPEFTKIINTYNIGELCEDSDSSTIHNAIKKILSSPDSYSHYKANLLIAKDNLIWEKESKVLENAYKDLILSLNK